MMRNKIREQLIFIFELMFLKDFYTYVDKHNLIGINAGKDREKFTRISMVHINHRVFAHSWYKKERSWFMALQEKKGDINYGGKPLKVIAMKLDKKNPMHKKIN